MTRALSIVALALTLVSPARAQDREERAKQLFFEAHEAADRGDDAVACRKFDESLALFRRASTLLNLGECSERLGRLATALRYWRQAAALLETSDARMELTKRRIAELERRVPRLELVLPPALPDGAVVAVDGRALPTEAAAGVRLDLPVDPGEHVVVLRAAGHENHEQHVAVIAGQRRRMQLRLGDRIRKAEPATAEEPESPLLVAGIAVGSVGVAVLVAGAVTGGLVLDRKATVEEHCLDDACTSMEGVEAAEEGRALATASTVAFAVGGAALATGIVLVVLGTTQGEGVQVSVRPHGVMLGGRF